MDTYGRAGAIAEEVLASIRTVVAFGGQQKEIDNYCNALKEAKRNSIIKGTLVMSTIGLMFGIVYAAYGVGFWYGLKMLQARRMNIYLKARKKIENRNIYPWPGSRTTETSRSTGSV